MTISYANKPGKSTVLMTERPDAIITNIGILISQHGALGAHDF